QRRRWLSKTLLLPLDTTSQHAFSSSTIDCLVRVTSGTTCAPQLCQLGFYRRAVDTNARFVLFSHPGKGCVYASMKLNVSRVGRASPQPQFLLIKELARASDVFLDVIKVEDWQVFDQRRDRPQNWRLLLL